MKINKGMSVLLASMLVGSMLVGCNDSKEEKSQANDLGNIIISDEKQVCVKCGKEVGDTFYTDEEGIKCDKCVHQCPNCLEQMVELHADNYYCINPKCISYTDPNEFDTPFAEKYHTKDKATEDKEEEEAPPKDNKESSSEKKVNTKKDNSTEEEPKKKDTNTKKEKPKEEPKKKGYYVTCPNGHKIYTENGDWDCIECDDDWQEQEEADDSDYEYEDGYIKDGTHLGENNPDESIEVIEDPEYYE